MAADTALNLYPVQYSADDLRAKELNAHLDSLLEELHKSRLQESVQDFIRRTLRESSLQSPQDRAKPNPPGVKVDGRIELVDTRDPSLVQISLGTNDGVNRNHTLDVYRANPEAKYLGTIRIVEVYPRKSVARWMPASSFKKSELMAGDLVMSKIKK